VDADWEYVRDRTMIEAIASLQETKECSVSVGKVVAAYLGKVACGPSGFKA
jgi:hypothetical protein